MAKANPQPDVLVLGEHPCALLAATLLVDSNCEVVHAKVPDEHPIDRLVILNPELFKLHPALEKLKRKLDLVGIWGLQFLADDGTTRGEYRSKSIVAYVASYAAIAAAVEAIAKSAGARHV